MFYFKYAHSWLLMATLVYGGTAATAAQEADKLPNAEEVIQDFVKVTGGVEKYKAIKSTKLTGKFSVPQAGLTGDMTIVQCPPNKVRANIVLAGLGEQKQGSNGKTAWELSTMTGPRILKDAEAKQLMEEANFEKVLAPKDYYKDLKCVGIEEVEGEKCYKVELTKHDDTKTTDYYSIGSKLLLRTDAQLVSNMGKMEVTSIISDYRDVDGMKTAFKMEQSLPNGMSQVIQMEKIEYNQEVDQQKTFELPAEIQELLDSQK
ncbi:MAG: outer membrane lipoprotein-sorting protein [Mariniblastus sp.]|nr:outer membrane lipoprotein-sorting protein [Mariniblastus sp.]